MFTTKAAKQSLELVYKFALPAPLAESPARSGPAAAAGPGPLRRLDGA